VWWSVDIAILMGGKVWWGAGDVANVVVICEVVEKRGRIRKGGSGK